MTGRKIGVVSMSDNHWGLVKEFIADIDRAIQTVKPGQFGGFAERTLVSWAGMANCETKR